MVQAVHKTPADLVIEAFGGVRATARALGLSAPTVCNWRKRGTKGLCGRVPSVHQLLILRIARERGYPLTATDLIEGRLIPK